MSAAARFLNGHIKVSHCRPLCLQLCSETLVHLLCIRRKRLGICRQLIQLAYFGSTNSLGTALKLDFLEQFSPLDRSGGSPVDDLINSNERRKLAVGISNIVKEGKGYLLKRFSGDFCPFNLVKIMQFMVDRQVAFAFFKYIFIDHSDGVVRNCFMAVRLLVYEEFSHLAQEILTWVIRKIGQQRSYELLWRQHCKNSLDVVTLDALMRSFTNAEMASCAMEVVDRMREIGYQPNVSAVCVLLKLLLKFGDIGCVWKLYRDMIREGPVPSIYVYNMMILGFCRRGSIRIGESLLYVMMKFGCEPDVHSYNILINGYCVRGWTRDASYWVDLMNERGCNPSLATYSTLISAFCKEGNVLEARKKFDEIQETDVPPNTVLYNALMDGYVKARELGTAIMLYEEMKSKGVAPDSVTLNILASGIYKYGDRNLSSLNESVLDSPSPDISICVLCWAGRLDEALESLMDGLERGVPHTVYAFNSLIVAYGKAGLDDKAIEVYHLMLKFGLNPSASTHSSLLLSLSKVGKLQQANEMIENGYPRSKVAFTVVLGAYFKEGDIQRAKLLWKEMEMLGLAPDAVAFSAFIDGLSKWGFVEDAHDMFLKMKSRGLVPNNFVYNSLILGFCNDGKLDEASKLEREMRRRSLHPDLLTCNIIINEFCKQGNMERALDIYNEMRREGVTPDTVTYNTLIWGYCKQFDMLYGESLANNIFCKHGKMMEAMDTYEEMLRYGVTPDAVTYNTLIWGYCKQFDMPNAEEMAERMQSFGLTPDVMTYNILIYGYCRDKRLNRAIMTFNDLISGGLVPNTVTYNTLIKGICCEFFRKKKGNYFDVLVPAMVLTGKLIKLAFIPDAITTKVLLSNLRKQGLPHQTTMWGEKLREISFEFDEITCKILEKAYHDRECPNEITEEGLFLDFLMHITYDVIRRSTIDQGSKFRPLEFTDERPSMHVEALNG